MSKKLTLTALGKKFCLTANKVKNTLVAAGYIDSQNGVNPERLADGTAEIVTAQDKFNGRGQVAFPVWDPEKIKHLFPEPDEKARAVHFRNRHDLEEKVIYTIKTLGSAANLKGCSKELLDILEQCEFSDPHFIGGPGVFIHIDTVDNANDIFDKIDDVFAELAPRVKDKKILDVADASIKAGRRWIIKQLSR